MFSLHEHGRLRSVPERVTFTQRRPVVWPRRRYPPLVALFRPAKVDRIREETVGERDSRVEVESLGGEGEERGEEENGERQIQQKRGEDGG
ncbi:hypothetical protein GBF38_009736 [Nibea albiflora]|uniref:Uncharacterized protein n=1 Tax=Nibea albiflora TaxID=240163 RepID=A0ACB7F8A4_NIBAL|nr:hypothetical protein GBF38_009736 [Nibea albiflora]